MLSVELSSVRKESQRCLEKAESMGLGEAMEPNPGNSVPVFGVADLDASRAALEARTLAAGDVIRFAAPLTFADGSERDTFRVAIDDFPGCRKRTVFECPETGARYRISAFRRRAWSLVSKGGAGKGAA